MPFPDKDGGEDVEHLMDTLALEGGALNEANLSSLSSAGFQELSELSHELHLQEDMETDDSEVVIEESVEEEEEETDDMMQTDIGAHEVEIETERGPSPEEILPDIKTVRPTKVETVPPLRPLTIAPKPAKLPIAMKPLQHGQQVFLLQGPGGTTQTVKLVSAPGGQELNLANFSLGRPMAIKPATTVKTLTSQSGGISILQPQPVQQPKQMMVTKKLMTTPTVKPVTVSMASAVAATSLGGKVTMVASSAAATTTAQSTATFATNKQGQQMVVLHKADQLKLLQAATGQAATLNTLPNSTKTFTLQQAQEMGLVPGRIMPQAQSTPKHVVNKHSGSKTVKLVAGTGAQLLTTAIQKTVPLGQVAKAPPKILPATTQTTTQTLCRTAAAGGGGGGVQRFILKSAPNAGAIMSPGQIIQVSGASSLNTVHQINIPGKGIQYVKFMSPPSNEPMVSSAAPQVVSSVKSNVSIATAPTSIVYSEIKPTSVATAIAPKPLKTLAVKSSVTGAQQHVMVLPTYVQSAVPVTTVTTAAKVPIPMRHTPHAIPSAQPNKQVSPESAPTAPAVEPNLEANGIRPRKPCNCTKSQCLKLYCDCFANGEFCYMCNCMNCFNNLGNEDHRQRAIKTCLERNPSAFRPKIGKAKDMSGDSSIRKHTKGCNCKRSGCLKNYCECYEAKIACSTNCKCVSCRNIEDSMDKRGSRAILEEAIFHPATGGKFAPSRDTSNFRQRRSSSTRHQPISFITEDVIEATTQCMLTVSDSCDTSPEDVDVFKRSVIEEMGRCMTEIIDYSALNTAAAIAN